MAEERKRRKPTKMERIAAAGRAAYYRNETLAEACPHPFGTAAFFAFNRGHSDAEAEHEAEHGPNAAMLLPCDPPNR